LGNISGEPGRLPGFDVPTDAVECSAVTYQVLAIVYPDNLMVGVEILNLFHRKLIFLYTKARDKNASHDLQEIQICPRESAAAGCVVM
jgi:hypothetical protein